MAAVNAHEEMVIRARRGDREAMAQVYRSYRANVYRTCLRIVRNPSDAEDLVQETFVRVISKIHTFRGESQFTTWLYRVTKNVALMQLRKPQLATLEFEDARDWEEAGESILALEVTRKPASREADGMLLDGEIKKLPWGYGRVLVLHDLLGYRHREISRITGITTNNSKSRLFRARRMLRKALRSRRPRSAVFEHQAAGL
jgi:RNA polymerase sigma-70 factor, ECF subfamily